VVDVSTRKPYDLEVGLDGGVMSVEVKGTMGDGAEIVLTRGEVVHHLASYPGNALVVVSGIRLEGPATAPEALGGVVRVISPWGLEDSGLTPIAYRYQVPG